MYKLEFTLKQHTPIIHFQHEQEGATLRASEVKPKLDKFIIEKFNKEGKDIPKDWLIGKGEHPALDYKMSVNSIGQMKNVIMDLTYNKRTNNKFPTFFANMGKDTKEELKQFTMFEKSNIVVLCFKTDLKDYVKSVFSEFIFLNNFGTRQSKGFGSFTVDEQISSIKIPYLVLGVDEDYVNIFNVINYYHQRLKSGINYSFQKKDKATDRPIGKRFCHYRQAFIKEYLRIIKADYIWDKKWLKETFFPLPPDENNKKFIRSFLGLSYDFKFGKNINPCNPKGVLPSCKIDVSIDTEKNKIQRIKSPITYKPVIFNDEIRIYIIVDDKEIQNNKSDIQGHEFIFSDGKKKEILKTPDSLIDYNDLIFEYNKHLTSSFDAYNFKGKPTKVKINNIYN